MDFAARVHSLEQQSRELSSTYEGLLHRIKRLREETTELDALRSELRRTQSIVMAHEAHFTRIKSGLPRIARKEELDRFSKRLDAMPFERFVLSRSAHEARGEVDGAPRY